MNTNTQSLESCFDSLSGSITPNKNSSNKRQSNALAPTSDRKRVTPGDQVLDGGSAHLAKTKAELAAQLAQKAEERASLQEAVHRSQMQLDVLEEKMKAAKLLKDVSRKLMELQ